MANNAENSDKGSLTEVDPRTAKPGKTIPVDDPYNMYWSPDGKYAIVVAEAHKRLDFRDAVTKQLAFSIATPDCAGINHADFSIDGRFALFTCEFNGSITKVDLVNRKVLGTIHLSQYFNRPEALAKLAAGAQDPEVHSRPGTDRRRNLRHARDAAGRARLTRRQDLLCRRHDGRRRACG